MRATKAYIASLGTTGVLIASSLLLLAFVSALVAFRGWPEVEASDEGAAGLVIQEAETPVTVSTLALDGDDPAAAARSARSRADADRGRDGREGGDVRTPDRDGGGDGGLAPRGTEPGGGDRTPAAGGGDVIGGAVPEVPRPLPGTTDNVRNGLSNLTEGTTQGVGNTVGTVSPNLGAPLGDTGKQLGGTVQETVPKSGTQPMPGVPVALP